MCFVVAKVIDVALYMCILVTLILITERILLCFCLINRLILRSFVCVYLNEGDKFLWDFSLHIIKRVGVYNCTCMLKKLQFTYFNAESVNMYTKHFLYWEKRERECQNIRKESELIVKRLKIHFILICCYIIWLKKCVSASVVQYDTNFLALSSAVCYYYVFVVSC